MNKINNNLQLLLLELRDSHLDQGLTEQVYDCPLPCGSRDDMDIRQ